jgi:hypothetical protein
VIYQTFRLMAVAAILLGLSKLSNLYKHCAKNSYCQFSSFHHCLNIILIHARMSSLFPPRAKSSLNLPVQSLAPPALPSLVDCFPCGSVDLGKYYLYSSALSRRACWRTLLAMLLGGAGESSFGKGYAADNETDASAFLSKEKKTRMQRYIYARRDTEDGPLEIITPQESLWYRFYVKNYYINEDVKLQKAFRLRFRLPYKQYLELVQQVQSNELFDRWCGSKSNNKKVSPVELIVLGSLRYLGRGWTFNDIEGSTAIDKEVHRHFFQVFIRFGSTDLYQKWVITPVDLPQADLNMHEYSQAGFPGCVGSCDCTHIVTKRCEYNLKNNHLGAKSSLTMRTFNLTCNHRRRILHMTNGGPGGTINQWGGWIRLCQVFVMVVSSMTVILSYLHVVRMVR